MVRNEHSGQHPQKKLSEVINFVPPFLKSPPYMLYGPARKGACYSWVFKRPLEGHVEGRVLKRQYLSPCHDRRFILEARSGGGVVPLTAYNTPMC